MAQPQEQRLGFRHPASRTKRAFANLLFPHAKRCRDLEGAADGKNEEWLDSHIVEDRDPQRNETTDSRILEQRQMRIAEGLLESMAQAQLEGLGRSRAQPVQ